jgi:hypothetical protein
MSLRVPLSLLRPATRMSIQSRRALSLTPRMFIKEDADRSPEQLEQKKQEQLKKQERGEGHWHEELASKGESNIAADREQVHDHEGHMEDLQKQTAKKGEKGDLN